MAQNSRSSIYDENNLKWWLVLSVNGYEGDFYKKWVFGPYFANTDPPSYKGTHFIFQNWYYFLKDFFRSKILDSKFILGT